jgi:hypothetical protein
VAGRSPGELGEGWERCRVDRKVDCLISCCGMTKYCYTVTSQSSHILIRSFPCVTSF